MAPSGLSVVSMSWCLATGGKSNPSAVLLCTPIQTRRLLLWHDTACNFYGVNNPMQFTSAGSSKSQCAAKTNGTTIFSTSAEMERCTKQCIVFSTDILLPCQLQCRIMLWDWRSVLIRGRHNVLALKPLHVLRTNIGRHCRSVDQQVRQAHILSILLRGWRPS